MREFRSVFGITTFNVTVRGDTLDVPSVNFFLRWKRKETKGEEGGKEGGFCKGSPSATRGAPKRWPTISLELDVGRFQTGRLRTIEAFQAPSSG